MLKKGTGKMTDLEEIETISKFISENSYPSSINLCIEKKISITDIQTLLQISYAKRRAVLQKKYMLSYVSEFIDMTAIHQDDKRKNDQLVGIDYEIVYDKKNYYQYTFHFRRSYSIQKYAIKMIKVRKCKEEIESLPNNHEEEEEYTYHLVSSSMQKYFNNPNPENGNNIYQDEKQFILDNRKLTTMISYLGNEKNCYQKYHKAIKEISNKKCFDSVRKKLLEDSNLYLTFEIVGNQVIIYRDNGDESNRELSILMDSNISRGLRKEFFDKFAFPLVEFQNDMVIALLSDGLQNLVRLRAKEDESLNSYKVYFTPYLDSLKTSISSVRERYTPIIIDPDDIEGLKKKIEVSITVNKHLLRCWKMLLLLEYSSKLYSDNKPKNYRYEGVTHKRRLEPIEPVKPIDTLPDGTFSKYVIIHSELYGEKETEVITLPGNVGEEDAISENNTLINETKVKKIGTIAIKEDK